MRYRKIFARVKWYHTRRSRVWYHFTSANIFDISRWAMWYLFYPMVRSHGHQFRFVIKAQTLYILVFLFDSHLDLDNLRLIAKTTNNPLLKIPLYTKLVLMNNVVSIHLNLIPSWSFLILANSPPWGYFELDITNYHTRKSIVLWPNHGIKLIIIYKWVCVLC